jgi:RimJ/RimL family protein N-acetyltransferase
MCIRETQGSPINEIKLQNLSKTGNSYSLDFMIGNRNYFGKGLGTITLVRFMDFFRTMIDEKADLFIIDPAQSNPRAKYVYMKAGFEHVGDFIMEGPVSSAGEPCHLLVKRFKVD